MTNNNNNNDNDNDNDNIGEEKDYRKYRDDMKSYHSFRLFSYLAMAVLSIAVMVGLFLVFQHLEEEVSTARSQANQETLLQNQDYLKKILDKTNEDNQSFFKILEDMTNNQTDQFQTLLKEVAEIVNINNKMLKENEEHEMAELNKMDFLLHLYNTTGSNGTQINSVKLDKILDILSSVKS